MFAISRKTIGLTIGLFLCSSTLAAPADDFRRGVESFNSQRYQLALQHFTAAQDAGMRTPALHYNLGIVHFRLRQYGKATKQFRLIADEPTWGALAHYNLGLIEERRGRTAQALTHYRTAHDRARTPRVQQLTAAKLSAVAAATAREAQDASWSGLLSTGGGFDDNVLLLDDESTVLTANEGDYFVEALGAATRYLQGDFEAGWRLGLAGYYRAYDDLNDFSTGSGNLGLFYGRLLEDWHVQAGGQIDLQSAGAEHFSTAGVFSAQGTRMLGSWVLRLREDLSAIEGGSAFSFVSGWQSRTGIDVTRRSSNGRFRFGYELEINDRDDLALGNEFFSYSPVRHKVFADVRQELSSQLRIGGRIQFRSSRYRDENTQVNADASVTAAKRDEDRLTGMLRVEYVLVPRWDLFGEYLYAGNDSSFDRYSYDNNQFMIGLERSF